MTMKNINAYSVGTYGDHLSAEKADSCKKCGLLSARHARRVFILCLLLAFVLCVPALAGDGYLTISGTYNGGYDQQFIYHDDMLLADASSGVSPEIAKVSVSLAGAAYQPDYINSMLEQMGFTYENFQFTERTINYNDLVAYTIGTKPIGDKMAFIVAVRGSSGNAEWFSNFNVGATESGDHAGFHTAAKNVSESLTAYLTNYPVDDRIVLVTGHSRGGAVANIVAAKLLQNDMVPENQLFAYTYACPNVSTNYDTSLNIHNFNITGDMVPEVPLAKWGYGCHGTTHDIIAPEGLYKNLTGKEYAGASVSTMYQDAFLQIAPTAQMLDEPFHQFLVMTAAYTMGGKADATVEEVAAKYLKNNGMTIAEKVIDKVIDKITGVSDIQNAMEHAKELYEAGHKLAEQLQKETEGMTPEEFEAHREKNIEAYNELMGLTGEIIADSASFSPTITFLLNSIQYADEAGSLAGDFYALLEDTSYTNPLDSVLDAHLMPIYTLWVNHEYYGYRGRILDSRKIRVPDGIVTIAPYCFADSDITGFTADSLIYISEYSFRDAAKLETVEIPNSVTYIGSNAFKDCTGLKYVTLPIEQSGFGAFTGCRNVQTITYTAQADGVMPARTSDSCTNTLEYICRESVQKIVYGEGVTEIADYANYNTYYSQLAEVQFPETLKRIGQSAFYKAAMYWLQLPESLEEIGDAAFFDCNTKHVNIPAALTKMGSNVFASCGNLQEIEFGGSAVGEYWFKDCTGLETLVIPNTVTSISTGAFNNCTGLKYVTLPIEQSGFGAFTGSRNVQTITYTAQADGVMPARTSDSCTNTLEYACRESVQKIVYGEGVTEIADYANYNTYYSQLSEVQFPETLKRIGQNAFYKAAMYWLQLPESLEEIGDNAFFDCNTKHVNIPAALTKMGSNVFASCGNLQEIEFGGSAVGEYWFKDCTGLETLVIPNTVTSISTGAFNNCTGLKYVTLPIEQSGFGTFTGCRNVLSITYTAQSDGVMPARTSSTYSGTLEYICRQSVQKIVYEEGVTEIADYANFHDNYSQLSNVTFPETLKRIGMCAFYKVKLYWMRLPESVEEIGDAAFRYCNQLNMIFLNKGLKTIGSTAFDIGATYRLFIVEPDTTASQFCADKKYPYTAPVDFSLSMKSKGVLSITRYNGSGGNVVIPEYISIYPVTAIEGTAFAGHEEITGVQISNRVSRIDDTAFDQATLNVLCEKDSFAYNWAVSKGYYLLPCCFTPDFEIQEAVLPGCFETGMTEGKHCKHCGTVLSVPEEVPAAGHTVVLESAFYETVPGSALEIPIGFSCGGVCGTQAHWCDRSEPTVMDVENGMITYTADESGIRILEMWPGEEKGNAVSCVVVIHTADRMTLPASLQEIGEEAFVGLATREFVLPDGMTGIASRAFAECANLSMIIIPDSVVNIADDAFDGSTGVTIICGEGSAAAAHAGTHEIPCIEIPLNKGN
ncbi:MAG: hypothetical protein E7337_08795 [Clostridiales bacterium]|nr:hypothetical protein [Clostridiales bacterium]